MHLESAEDLVRALQGSGLFTPEQIGGIVRDLAAFGPDLAGGMKYIIKHGRVTHYQLGKIIRGKTADLAIGPYIILDKLGEGGMGKVFRARHARTDRTVALKVIRPSLVANPTVRGRYAREVQATGKLHHPNIVSIDDAGEADGKFFLAMEFVDGIDLARMMRDFRTLEVVEACEYVRQAALGLHHAHGHGLVHRDIKPSNIVVAGERHLPQATEPAAVKVLDLGLARAIDPDDMVAPDLTRDHTVVGTPDYMAPEQAKNSKLVDARADLYSLGCTFYFLLTGHPPFPTGNAIEKLMQHQLDRPAPLQGVRPGVPAPVAEIVAKLMSKRPEDRFQTAADLAAALAVHAVYPHGSVAVPVVTVRTSTQTQAPSGDTLPPRGTASASSVVVGASSSAEPLNIPDPTPVTVPQSVAPSDHTPRPADLAAALPKVAAPGRASTKRHPAPKPSRPRAKKRGARKPPPVAWLIGVAVLVLLFLVALVWAVLPRESKPEAPQPTVNPEPGAKPGPNPVEPRAGTGIAPAVNRDRLHALGALIPDGSGAVVVAYPSAYLKQRESPFTAGAGPAKFAQYASRLQTETELSLGQSDRVVLSLQAANPAAYVLTSEGAYLGPKFVADLEKRFPSYRPLAKAARPFKAYSVGTERAAALFQPPASFPNGAPVYFYLHGRDMVERSGQRLALSGWKTAPDLELGVLPVLSAAPEPPLPLLVGAASGRQKLPFPGQPTVKDLGASLVVVALRITDQVELDVRVQAGSHAEARKFVEQFVALLREERPLTGRLLAASLSRALSDAPNDPASAHVTLKIRWTAEQWSAFLEQLLG